MTPSIVTITAKGTQIDLEVGMPASFQEAVTEWGEDIVFSLAMRQAKSDVGNCHREMAKRDNPPSIDEIKESAKAWIPGVRMAKVRINPLEALMNRITSGTATPEDINLVAQLTQAAKAVKK